MIDLLENLVVEQYLEIGADFLEESVFAKPNLQIQARAQPTDAESTKKHFLQVMKKHMHESTLFHSNPDCLIL